MSFFNIDQKIGPIKATKVRMADIRKSYVLFLPGIKPEDCDLGSTLQDEEGDEYISETGFNEDAPTGWLKDVVVEYDELPSVFISFEQWVKSTSLQCLACALVVPEVPWFIPVSWKQQLVYRDSSGMLVPLDSMETSAMLKTVECDVYKPHGPFCTPLCAKRYLNRVRDPKIINAWESSQILDRIINRYYDLRPDRVDLPEAEDKAVMIQYCGTKRGITPQAFRETNAAKLAEFLRQSKKKTTAG